MNNALIWFIVWLSFKMIGLGISIAFRGRESIVSPLASLIKFLLSLLFLWGMGVFGNF